MESARVQSPRPLSSRASPYSAVSCLTAENKRTSSRSKPSRPSRPRAALERTFQHGQRGDRPRLGRPWSRDISNARPLKIGFGAHDYLRGRSATSECTGAP